MDSLTIIEKRGGFEISAHLYILGNDLLVVLRGGAEHIGAIGMAQPRKSLSDPEKISATSSVFTYEGHKEDVVVKPLSEELSKRLNKKVVVVAGIHWDGLKSKEIEQIIKICRILEQEIVKEIIDR